ncbi:MAG: ubiquinol-cytochrome c reductase iron-sulfur subunit [Gaiellales bacterium]
MSDGQGTTRGRFLGVITIGMGAAIGGAVAAPSLAYVLAPATQEARFTPVSLGPANRFSSEAGFHPTPVAYVQDAAQPDVSSGLAYVHSTGGKNTDWLATDAMFVVFSNRCTHVGCPVEATIVGFSCPCHGSQFDRQGARTAGPAVRPLDRFQWEVRADGDLWLTQRWSVLIDDSRVRYYPVKSPGQPLDGQIPAADLLYPPVTYTRPPGRS